MSNVKLYDIARTCGPSPGGLRDLGLIAPQDVDTLSPLTFLPGKRMYLYQQNRFSGRLVRKADDGNRAGDVVDYTLSAFVSGIRLEMDLLATALLNRRVHVLATYWSGEQVLLRNMRLLHGHDSAERIPGKIGYSLAGRSRTRGGASLLGASLELPTISVGAGGEDPGPLPSGGVTVIPITTTASTYLYLIPAGSVLDLIYVRSASAQTIRIGTTVGGNELLEDYALGAGQYALAGTNLLYATTATLIYFTGLVGTNSIKIYLKA